MAFIAFMIYLSAAYQLVMYLPSDMCSCTHVVPMQLCTHSLLNI